MNDHFVAVWRRWTRRRRHDSPPPSSCAVRTDRRSMLRSAGEPQHGDALPTYQLTRVDDPDGRSVILAIRGLLADPALDALHRAADAIPPRATIHLDLAGASILTEAMMRRLEAWTDALDDAGHDVRITGLSPHHPALRHQRHR